MKRSTKRFYKIEIVFAIACILCFVFGIAQELMVSNHKYFIAIDNIRNFTMVILQLQASISTVTVALLALISGMINEDVYGISITRYYMLIRPKLFKQTRVVIFTISLVFTGAIFEMFELYNMVFACFFIEWFLIVISVIEIFPVFYGRQKCVDEIEDYIAEAFSSEDVQEKINMITIFQGSWMNNLDDCDFDNRKKLLLMSVENMLLENSDDAITYVNKYMEELIRAHLSHNENWIIGRGFQLIESVYEQIWLMVLNHRVDTHKTKSYPAIFQNLFYDVRSALLHLDIKELEECFDFQSISEYCARVTVHYLEDNDELCTRALSTLESYASMYGFVLTLKQSDGMRKLDEVDINYWTRMLEHPFISSVNIPDSMLSVFQLHRCKLYFSYISSLIQDGNTDFIIRYFYCSNDYAYNDGNIYIILLHLAVQCYLYYLAYAESINVVPEKARNAALYILSQKKEVCYPFEAFIEGISWRSYQVFIDNDFEMLIKDVLKGFELFNMGHVKRMIMTDTVRTWYAAFVLYMLEKYHFRGEVTDYLHGDILSYVVLFLRDNADKTADELTRVYELLSFRQIDDIEQKKAELYGKLKTSIIESYKTVDINEALVAQHKYEAEDIENTVIENVTAEILDTLHKTFAPIIDDSIRPTNEQNVVLINLHDQTKMVSEKSILGTLGYMEGNLCDYLISYLFRAGKVEAYHREDKSDEEFIEYMKKNSLSVLVGSEYALQQEDYRNRSLFDEFESDCECIYTIGANALALEKGKLKISIDGLNISIRSGDLKDNNISYDEETGRYKIKFFDDIEGVFDKQEAMEYSKNKYKIIEVGVKLVIQAENDAGIVIYK